MTETAQTVLASPDVLLVTSGDYSDFGVREVLLIPPGRDPKADIAQWNAVWDLWRQAIPTGKQFCWSDPRWREARKSAIVALAVRFGVAENLAMGDAGEARIQAGWLVAECGYKRLHWTDSQDV